MEQHLYLDSLFKSLDPDVIIKELSALIGRDIQTPGSVLFLDEIQATPHAIQALRYFYEITPELAVVSAGSLLEFALANLHFSMPVGRIEYYHLGPMTFREYLTAIEPSLNTYLSEFHIHKTLPKTAHQKLIKRQREFFFVGGMPEAIAAFVETDALSEVTVIHRSIAETYQDDFSKYANAEVDYVTAGGNKIIPIEVKSGKSGTLKSLQQFVLNKHADLCVRFDLNPPGFGKINHLARVKGTSRPVSYTLLSLPLYMVEELHRILKEIRMEALEPV